MLLVFEHKALNFIGVKVLQKTDEQEDVTNDYYSQYVDAEPVTVSGCIERVINRVWGIL